MKHLLWRWGGGDFDNFLPLPFKSLIRPSAHWTIHVSTPTLNQLRIAQIRTIFLLRCLPVNNIVGCCLLSHFQFDLLFISAKVRKKRLPTVEEKYKLKLKVILFKVFTLRKLLHLINFLQPNFWIFGHNQNYSLNSSHRLRQMQNIFVIN